MHWFGATDWHVWLACMYDFKDTSLVGDCIVDACNASGIR